MMRWRWRWKTTSTSSCSVTTSPLPIPICCAPNRAQLPWGSTPTWCRAPREAQPALPRLEEEAVPQPGLAHTVLVPAKEAGLERGSVALCHQIRALDRRKLKHKIGELAPEPLSEIELAAAFVMGLP